MANPKKPATKKRGARVAPKKAQRVLAVPLPATATPQQVARLKKLFHGAVLSTTGAKAGDIQTTRMMQDVPSRRKR